MDATTKTANDVISYTGTAQEAIDKIQQLIYTLKVDAEYDEFDCSRCMDEIDLLVERYYDKHRSRYEPS